MKKGPIFTLLFVVFFASAAFAQRGSVKGTVLDSQTGEPLVGTAVLVEGTTLGTVTDIDGSFTISNILPGPVSITAHYLGYEVLRRDVEVFADRQAEVQISLRSQGVNIADIYVVAEIDRESENVLLSEQKDAVVATQAMGAVEMSRKGLGDAQMAVANVSGISRQESVKNVFVRGLGDRYNATFLNGFPLPSEDPEYKNIALEFFGTDVIQNIGVNKVFSARNNGDVAGAVIDINSKELSHDEAFSVSIGTGINTQAVAAEGFKKPDGVNYLGMSRADKPSAGRYDYVNRLNPSTVRFPLNHSYGISGGRRFRLGAKRNPLSLFVTASHSTGYSFTGKTTRNANTADLVFRDQKGTASSIDINQLALANVDFNIGHKHELTYNFLLIHANHQYVTEYLGVNGDKYKDHRDYGFMRRQQSNDNLLTTHQLITKFTLHDRWQLGLGAAYNTVKGNEPDRRENNLSLQPDGGYNFTGSSSQLRFFSTLKESDLNVKADLRFHLSRKHNVGKSNLMFGYRGRFLSDDFEAGETFSEGYDLGPERIGLDTDLDGYFNPQNLTYGRFSLSTPREYNYKVAKHIHSGYAEVTQQIAAGLVLNAGFQVDYTSILATYSRDESNLQKIYYLPSLNLRWDITSRHTLRLGASQSYTLPQSKEIIGYMYYNVDFSSVGDKNVRPSDNYNIDLKWDWYIGSSELVSIGAFYKHITNPIVRVDKGSSSLALTYYNNPKPADVAGVEIEVRKNILNINTNRTGNPTNDRLSFGVSASYICSSMNFFVDGTNIDPVKTRLEGASPWLVNGDLSYSHVSNRTAITLSLVANWFSDRVHTLGTRGYKNMTEEGVVTLSFVSSFKLGKHFTLKFKADNLLDRPYRLTREYAAKGGSMVMSEYKKGVGLSLGLTFDL